MRAPMRRLLLLLLLGATSSAAEVAAAGAAAAAAAPNGVPTAQVAESWIIPAATIALASGSPWLPRRGDEVGPAAAAAGTLLVTGEGEEPGENTKRGPAGGFFGWLPPSVLDLAMQHKVRVGVGGTSTCIMHPPWAWVCKRIPACTCAGAGQARPGPLLHGMLHGGDRRCACSIGCCWLCRRHTRSHQTVLRPSAGAQGAGQAAVAHEEPVPHQPVQQGAAWGRG